MLEIAHLGVHIYHPDGRYDEPVFSRKRSQLVQKRPAAFFLAESVIEDTQRAYDLRDALVIPTAENSPLPIAGWDAAFQLIAQHIPASVYVLWGAELIIANIGFDKYQGCVGTVSAQLQMRKLNAELKENNCFVIQYKIDWDAFFKAK